MTVKTERVITSRNVIGRIMMQLNAPPAGWVAATSMEINSDQDEEEYGWLGMAPELREWVGSRQAAGLRESTYKVRNKHFEATLDIPTRWLRRDKTGQLEIRIADLTRRGNDHWAKLLTQLIIDGESTACYDGQYFFDVDHSEGDSGTQSNDISVDISAVPAELHGTTTAPSVEEMQYAISAGIAQIQSFKDDQGAPLNADASQFLVMVPTTTMHLTANRAVGGIVKGASAIPSQLNVDPGVGVSVAQNPRLVGSWSDKFAIFRTDSPMKPFIRQAETPLMVAAKAEGSEYEFDHDAHQYGIDGWRNVGYGLWQQGCLVTLA